MPSRVRTTLTIIEALDVFGTDILSTAQAMEARVATPSVEGIDLWKVSLDSRTRIHYGGRNDDGLYRFKIEREPSRPAAMLIDKNDGSMGSDKFDYERSRGVEFIIIKAGIEYAMSSDRYKASGALSAAQLEENGAFKLNTFLNPDEVVGKTQRLGELELPRVHGGWLELAVHPNGNVTHQYMNAIQLVEQFAREAQNRGAFADKGMGFFVNTSEEEYKICHLYIDAACNGSSAIGTASFKEPGIFLRQETPPTASSRSPQ